MKALNLVLGLLVMAASVLAVPAVLGSIVAGAAGLLLMVSAGQAVAMPAPRAPEPVAVVRSAVVERPEVRVLLDGGRRVAVFKVVNGQLISRCLRV